MLWLLFYLAIEIWLSIRLTVESSDRSPIRSANGRRYGFDRS